MTAAMLTLGALLALARREAGPFAAWLAIADPVLAAQITGQCAPDEPPAGFVREAVAAFELDAEDTDWSHLISATRDASDPAIAALGVMIRWRLACASMP